MKLKLFCKQEEFENDYDVYDFLRFMSDTGDGPCDNCWVVKDDVKEGRTPESWAECTEEEKKEMELNCKKCIFFWLDEVELTYLDGSVDCDEPEYLLS